MTPKEKAKELVDTFYQTTPNKAWYNPPLGSTSMEYKAWWQAKECALSAVDGILNDVGAKDWSGDIACEGRNYWQEVKKEIEKL